VPLYRSEPAKLTLSVAMTMHRTNDISIAISRLMGGRVAGTFAHVVRCITATINIDRSPTARLTTVGIVAPQLRRIRY
jgi:hypothetical protein